MKNPRKPIFVLSAKRLAREHGLSIYRISRAMDQGLIVPFCVTGETKTDAALFHPDQLEHLREVCADRPRRRWRRPIQVG